MNFELNEDQAALAESLSRLLADRYGFEKRRALTASGAAHDEKTWAGLAELGLTALPVPEALGGFGGGARDLLPAMQAFGRSLSMEPFLASAVLAGTALRLGADEAMLVSAVGFTRPAIERAKRKRIELCILGLQSRQAAAIASAGS